MFSKKSTDYIREILLCGIILLVLYLFYKSVWVLTLLLPCILFCRKMRKKEESFRYRALLNAQFKDLLESLTASLRAGYSIENALKECRKEMDFVHGEDSPICCQLKIMENQMEMGIQTEEIFHGLAARSGVEDIRTFASVFSIAKRTGGDLVEIIQKTADDIESRLDTEKEIGVLIASKKLEHRVMSLVPAGIILYMDLTSDGLLDPLYGNLTGIFVMTICLLVYVSAIFLGQKIMRIEV